MPGSKQGSKAYHPFGVDPVIMGIVNVTPDSFSDGGKYYNKNRAIEHGLRLAQEGAVILDIGGESTRPGAQIVDIQEEIQRIVPVIEGLRGKVPFISIDTRNAQTMRAALKAGANAINDISGLAYDSESLAVASEAQVPVFLMHSKGTPQDMQKNPSYNNVLDDIYAFFEERLDACRTARIETKKRDSGYWYRLW
ncbi:MAG: dihydropteroate synthase [Alphaproteobacteria bacterium]|nr:dihydropteroate synthase [Alphaproteobacteria bacterium]